MTEPRKMTPMLRQYLEMKARHPGCILFYRMGDFYEMFLEDAETAAPVLGVALTTRSREHEEKIPMCGVPWQALDSYLAKMIRAGFRVALCEQVEDPKTAKGIVRREVVRVVSPGMAVEDQILDEKKASFLCALLPGSRGGKGAGNRKRPSGLAFLDLSTGHFLISEVSAGPDWEPLFDALTRLDPVELVLPQERIKAEPELDSLIRERLKALCLTIRPDIDFERAAAERCLNEHFRTVNLAGFGCEGYGPALQAAGALLAYVQETQKTDLGHISRIRPLHQEEFLIIDEASRRNLELTETLSGGKREGSLLHTLDMTVTPMGARLFRHWLLFPLREAPAIRARLGAVEELAGRTRLRAGLREALSRISDIERLCSRLSLGQGHARDLNNLRASLERLPGFKALLSDAESPLLKELADNFDPLEDVAKHIEQAIREDAPLTLKEGGLIREGYNAELDKLLVLVRDGKKLILDLEAKERRKSGLSRLKVGFNRVFGYYFELNRAQSDEVPPYFIRKQTLANAERYITPELKELEESIGTAQERRLNLEFDLFSEVRDKTAAQSARLLAASRQLANGIFAGKTLLTLKKNIRVL